MGMGIINLELTKINSIYYI